jgi:hypothetical protein
MMGVEEGEEMQAKCIGNIFNKIIAENFPNLEKDMPIPGTGGQTDMLKIESIHGIL